MTEMALPEDLAELISGPILALISTCNADNRPLAARVWSAAPSADRSRIKVLLPAEFDDGFDPGGQAALSLSDVRSGVSYQVKGPIVGRGPLDDLDRERFAAYREEVLHVLEKVFGPDAQKLRAMMPTPVSAVTVGVRDIFVQTPGPGAGRRLGEAVTP